MTDFAAGGPASRVPAGSIELEWAPVDPDQVVAGDPQVGLAEIAAAPGVEVGVWAHTVGVSTDIETDEVSDLAELLGPVARRLDTASAGSTRDADLATFRAALDSLRTRTAALEPDAHSAALPMANGRAAGHGHHGAQGCEHPAGQASLSKKSDT